MTEKAQGKIELLDALIVIATEVGQPDWVSLLNGLRGDVIRQDELIRRMKALRVPLPE
jgi:hypothetical protein